MVMITHKEARQGFGHSYLNRRGPKQCGPSEDPVSRPTVGYWQGDKPHSCRRAIHSQKYVERTL